MKNKMYLICQTIVILWHCTSNTTDNRTATHFVVPAQSSNPIPIHKHSNFVAVGSVIKILFSPDDNVTAELIAMINQEQARIRIAIYLLTDETIAQALLQAHHRGVHIEIIIDPKHMYDRFGRIEELCQKGLCVFMFNPKYGHPRGTGLMHNKFVIFGDDYASSSSIWTGSFNFTRAAGEDNQEHVLIVQGQEALQQFAKHFECLKGRCTQYRANEKNSNNKPKKT